MTYSTLPRARRPMRRRSDKGAAARDAGQHVVETAELRDGGCLLRGLFGHRCVGRLSPHHLRKASQGGDFAAMNIVTLCLGANGAVELDPDLWHARGLVIRRGETDVDAWRRMAAHGIHPR